MENASKALLIAGAILIVILLIAVGMLVYSKSRSVIDTGVAQMSSTEISMFNAQFNEYSGSQKGSSIKALLQAVIANNATYSDDTSKQVKVSTTNITNATNDSNLIKNEISSVKSSSTYSVSFGYNNGLISEVDISSN